MAGSLIDLAGQVLYTGVAQHGPDGAYTGAIVAYGVSVTGDEQDGQVLGDSLSPAFAADVVEGGQHLPVGARGEREGAELVGVIIPYDLGVAAEPGVGRGGIRDALAIAAEIQIDHQGRDGVVALDGGNQSSQTLADGVHHAGTSCAGNDKCRDTLRPLFSVPSGIKAAHAVAVQDDGQAGKTLVQQAVHCMQVVQQMKAAVLFAVVAVLPCLGGVAVAQVVVACQGNAMGSVEIRHRCIAADVLAHAVAELDDCPHGHVRAGINDGRGGMFPVRGRKRNVFAVEGGHGYSPLIIFQYWAKACSFLLSPGS